MAGRVLEVVEAGETPKAAAQRFAVARSTAYRWVAAAHDEKRREAKPVRGGPAPRIQGAAVAAMLGLADGPDHLTLGGIAACPAEARGVLAEPRSVCR